jgi:ABC-type Fe3+ transport system substrate-binding protein
MKATQIVLGLTLTLSLASPAIAREQSCATAKNNLESAQTYVDYMADAVSKAAQTCGGNQFCYYTLNTNYSKAKENLNSATDRKARACYECDKADRAVEAAQTYVDYMADAVSKAAQTCGGNQFCYYTLNTNYSKAKSGLNASMDARARACGE